MKTALISLLALAILLIACGSTQAAGPMKCGVKAGITISDQKYDYSGTELDLDVEPNSRKGLTLGIFFEKDLVKAFSLRAGADYIQKGSEISALVVDTGGNVLGTRELQDRISYVSVSVMGKANVPLGKLSTYALFGPRLDFKVSSDSEFGTAIDSDLNTTVFGLTFGVGQQFPVQGMGTLLLEVTYHHDLGDAYEGHGLTVQNKALAVMAGFVF